MSAKIPAKYPDTCADEKLLRSLPLILRYLSHRSDLSPLQINAASSVSSETKFNTAIEQYPKGLPNSTLSIHLYPYTKRRWKRWINLTQQENKQYNLSRKREPLINIARQQVHEESYPIQWTQQRFVSGKLIRGLCNECQLYFLTLRKMKV